MHPPPHEHSDHSSSLNLITFTLSPYYGPGTFLNDAHTPSHWTLTNPRNCIYRDLGTHALNELMRKEDASFTRLSSCSCCSSCFPASFCVCSHSCLSALHTTQGAGRLTGEGAEMPPVWPTGGAAERGSGCCHQGWK